MPRDSGLQDQGHRIERRSQLWKFERTAQIKFGMLILPVSSGDNFIHYIYLVVDNFSRKILSWFVASKVSSTIRKQTIHQALSELKINDKGIVLITDGGPENSFDVNENYQSFFTHLKAMTDINCSNSLIEAHNKVIKYNYLYRMTVDDGNQLKKVLEWSIDNFNSRPHISLHGSTPNESYDNVALDIESLKELKKVSAQARKLQNKKDQCAHCPA